MKISLNWIKKYIDLPSDVTMEKLAYDLTMRTVEVEGYEDFSEKYKNIVAGRIVEVKTHPDADKLRIVIVDVGEDENLQIVCGGSNLDVDSFVVVAKPGSQVIWHGEGEPVEIKKTKMRGIESFGMICGANEVGLEDIYPPKEDHEIVVLNEPNIKAGDNIASILGFDDQVLEIDNKSLTNRPDLYCHYGIARELSAIYNVPLAKIEDIEPLKLDNYSVEIKNTDKCSRYMALVIENVKNIQSPMWLKTALIKVGMRPRNVIVDITNYVMLAVGQPTHAFDESHVKDGIIVRNAFSGEKLELLDGEELELAETNLVIADSQKALGLAGIMGGKDDSILPDTNAVVIEIANFAYDSVRSTSRKFDLRTEASIRFEKDLDTQRVDSAFSEIVRLFRELLPDCKITKCNDVVIRETIKSEVDVELSFLEERLGVKVDSELVKNTLLPLGFEIELNGAKFKAIAPTWRSTGDISLKEDILEEVARMMGYESFESKYPRVELNHIINQRDFDKEREIKEFLAFRGNFREIFTYPWVEEKYCKAINTEFENLIKIDDPPSPTTSYLRDSVIPGILFAIEVNYKNFEEYRIFEMAHVFKKGECSPSSPDEILPIQENHLGGAIVGENPEKLFFEMKGILEGFNFLKIEKIEFGSENKPQWADKNLWLNIISNGEVVGSFGAASIKTLAESDIKNCHAILFELNIEKIIHLESRTNSFEKLPLFPPVIKDLSITVDESVKWSEIDQVVNKLVKKVNFVDEYRGKQVPEGKKSITFRVEIWSEEKTLSSEEIEEKMNRILNKLSGKFGAELRN